MGRRSASQSFRADQVAWRAGMMVRAQSIMTLLLMVWLAAEYNYNAAFQSLATGTLGMFGFLLGGTLATIYGGTLIVMYLSPPVTPANREKAKRREMAVMVTNAQRRKS